MGLLLRAEQKAELKARPSRELREIPEELCDFKQSETAGKFGSFRHKVETDASTDTSKSSSSTKLQLYTRAMERTIFFCQSSRHQIYFEVRVN